MKSQSLFLYGGVLAIIISVLLFGYIVGLQQKMVFGSTPSEASDYQATSTAPSAFYGATTGGFRIKTGAGSLGSVNILGANTGALTFYNATTSNILARTGSTATSSILLTSIPPSLAAGTYTFDLAYTTGLLMVLEPGGIMPTTTVSWR